MKRLTTTILWSFLILYYLTGCASKEAREFKNDEDNQKEIAEEIIRIGKEKYNIELKPDPDKIAFNTSPGIPLTDDSSLLIPVETTGKPVYSFKAQVFLEKQSDDSIEVDHIDIERSHSGLDGLGKYLVQHMYNEKYSDIIFELEKYDSRISIGHIDVNAVTSYHFDDREEKDEIIKNLIADYNNGHFANLEMFEVLYDRYVPKWEKSLQRAYLPDVQISIEGSSYEGEEFDLATMKRINYGLKAEIIQSNKLPLANYSIHTYNTMEKGYDEESYHTIVRKIK
ncbi:hypothetical protein [Gracilibacillus suaedae]|uniref:hypothetical protein n=1 Tax=Gracilibacillus suaedae TaxID=2820273 RepID=UPI001ABEBE75|nr:hypothetical protein [Gracilibacillus suaedae]